MLVKQFGPPETVHVELEWYDGPRAGVADIHGVAHRFKSLFDESDDEYQSKFMVWPISDAEFVLEVEQWQIFVRWNSLYEAGKASWESHPGHGSKDRRWDELECILRPLRVQIPPQAVRALAQLVPLPREVRYDTCGPDYELRWCLC